MSSHMVFACSASGGDQEKPSTSRSHTRRSPTSRLLVPPQPPRPSHPLQPLHSLKTSPAAARQNAARSMSTPSCGTGSSTCWTSGKRKRDGARSGACARSSGCRGDQPEHFLPLETERTTSSTARQEKSVLTRRHDTAERAHHAGDRRPVPECGHDPRLVARLAPRRGTRRPSQEVVECVKEHHSLALQEANKHQLFKLCWLMDKDAVSTDRVVNIDETSCRLLPVHQIGWGRRGVKQAQLQGNTKEATTFTIAFSINRGPLDMHDPTARGHIGRRDEPKQRKTWPAPTPARPPWPP